MRGCETALRADVDNRFDRLDTDIQIGVLEQWLKLREWRRRPPFANSRTSLGRLTWRERTHDQQKHAKR